MSRPIALLISDVHYNLQTLKLADAAMRQAIQKANDLNIPLIVAGDLHDTKANLRGECVNAMIKTFSLCENTCYILRGNHDAINEKSSEHSLNFLRQTFSADEYGTEILQERVIIDKPEFCNELGVRYGNSVWLMPYYHSPDDLRASLKRIDKGSCVIMHQGLIGGHMGDYIQDKSAITYADVPNLRVISGHYHTRQTRTYVNGCTWDYIGNPYTLTWSEAQDPEKGFQVLYNDGSLEFIPSNLRRHIVRNFDIRQGLDYPGLKLGDEIRSEDLVWIKVYGSHEELSQVTRSKIAKIIGRDVFKLTTHPLETTQNTVYTPLLTHGDTLDSLIDGLSNTSDGAKQRIKTLWKEL